nr:MAG TPA: hypothetical protein [Caudoviricetes sp.]
MESINTLSGDSRTKRRKATPSEVASFVRKEDTCQAEQK